MRAGCQTPVKPLPPEAAASWPGFTGVWHPARLRQQDRWLAAVRLVASFSLVPQRRQRDKSTTEHFRLRNSATQCSDRTPTSASRTLYSVEGSGSGKDFKKLVRESFKKRAHAQLLHWLNANCKGWYAAYRNNRDSNTCSCYFEIAEEAVEARLFHDAG
jgi:hypothetical protein